MAPQRLPPEKPKATLSEVLEYIKKAGYELDFTAANVWVVAYRHYYSKLPKNNACACACWVLWQEKGELRYEPFNHNTVPSFYNPNNKEGLGTAELVPGLYDYKIGLHKKVQSALVQAAPVKVKRIGKDGKVRIESLPSSINIHKCSANQAAKDYAWSKGCQTKPPLQHEAFMTLIALKAGGKNAVKYLLLDPNKEKEPDE